MSSATDAWALGGLADVWSSILAGIPIDKMALNRISGADFGEEGLRELLGKGMSLRQAQQQLAAQTGWENSRNRNAFDTAELKGRYDLAGKGMEQATERWKLPQTLQGAQEVARIGAGGTVGAAKETAGAHLAGAKEQAGANRYMADKLYSGKLEAAQAAQKVGDLEYSTALRHFEQVYKKDKDGGMKAMVAAGEYIRGRQDPKYVANYPQLGVPLNMFGTGVPKTPRPIGEEAAPVQLGFQDPRSGGTSPASAGLTDLRPLKNYSSATSRYVDDQWSPQGLSWWDMM